MDIGVHRLKPWEPLYDDVVCSGKYGSLYNVWFSPGHVFVAVRAGIQLFTFDTKPANKIIEDNRGCLDLQGLDPPVFEVLVSGTNYSLVYIVQSNGHVQCWKYKADCTWILFQRFDICNVNKAEIASICLHPTHNAFYWCEKRPTGSCENSVYCICKRQLPEGEDRIKQKDLGPVIAFLHNCPSCIVYPTILGLAVFVKNEEPLVSMLVVWKTASSKVMVFMGPHQVELSEFGPQQAIDFRTLGSRLIGITTNLPLNKKLKNVVYNSQKIEVRLVEQDGTVRRTLDETDCSDEVSLDMDKVNMEDKTEWFDFQGMIGAVTGSKIWLYSSKTGQYIGQLESPDDTKIKGLCNVSSGMLFNGFFTDQNIYVIERKTVTEKENIDLMISTKKFQTNAVQLSFLEQQKSISPSSVTYDKRMELRRTWDLESDKLPLTKLTEIINPYLKEYWKLEDLQQGTLNHKLSFPSLCPSDIEEEVLHVLSPETSMTMAARQAWLLLLADTYPKQVLTVLMSQLEFETEDISSSQLQRWQCILANDCVDSPVSSDVAVPMFEHICRLLFKVQPNRLVNFVKIAHLINDQRVGVSAFIRKRQALQYYDRALDCLPDLGTSECFDDAITANVQLLLASEQDDCEMRALDLYLKHNQWQKAVDLLQEYTNTQQYYKLFLSTLTVMSDKNVLSQFANEVFALMPELKSFAVLSTVLEDRTYNNKSDPPKARDVFVQTPRDIKLEVVRQHLLKKISSKATHS